MDIVNEYFEWLYGIVCDGRYSSNISFRKLLMFLHNSQFVWSIPKDENRADDGTELRYRFAVSHDYNEREVLRILSGPCSMLEMMLALSIRIEEDIMDDTEYGDRTAQWFWGMVNSLGLGSMTDERFDKVYAEDVIEDFIGRDYAPNGKGGLFTIRHCDYDLREVEIWTQMCWYLDGFIS